MQRIYVRPRLSYDLDGYVEWSVNTRKWYPISHIYVGTEDELPQAGATFKTVPNSPLKTELNDLWRKGFTVQILGDYSRETKRLIVIQIVRGEA